MCNNKKSASERQKIKYHLSSRLKEIMEESREIKSKKEEFETVSVFNFFKKQKLKYNVGNGIVAIRKSLYDWENEFMNYKECLELGPSSVFVPYLKLIASFFCIFWNILLVVDLFSQ